jgi:ketosteroid isomerase-like protein
LNSNGLGEEKKMSQASTRSAKEVLDDHLRESREGSVEADLARNYAEDVVVLSGRGIHRGHDGLRQLAEMLRKELPDSTFEYRTYLVEEEVGFLEWSGRSENAYVDDGADSYVIRDGKIVAQIIHYTVKRIAPQSPSP